MDKGKEFFSLQHLSSSVLKRSSVDEALQEVPLHSVDLRRESLMPDSVDVYFSTCERGSWHFKRGGCFLVNGAFLPGEFSKTFQLLASNPRHTTWHVTAIFS